MKKIRRKKGEKKEEEEEEEESESPEPSIALPFISPLSSSIFPTFIRHIISYKPSRAP